MGDKSKRIKDLSLVLIEWQDSRQPIAYWQHLDNFEPYPVVLCHTVGYLVNNGRQNKAVAQNIADINCDDGSMQVSGIMHIPTRCITKITPLS